jgi:hypothetical protein
MSAKAKYFPLFELRATGTLQVGETIVPVTITIDASCGRPAAVGCVYGPGDALFQAYYHQQGVIEIGGVKVPARFHSLDHEGAYFDAPPLFRALARHAAYRLASGV